MWRKFSILLTLAAVLGALGCGSSSSSTIAVTVSPSTASVITNRTQQFTAGVTGTSNEAVNWTLACASGVAANTCGTIDATGLYTAPATLPTTTSNGTTTVTPTVTITATSQDNTSRNGTATLTIITGISIVLTPTTATVGTGEFYLFSATVSNPGCNLISNPNCQNVTWSLSTTLTGIGTIGSTTGVYTAPPSVPVPSTVVITATSVADTSVTATATVTVVSASIPTVTSVSPNTTGLGGLFQDIYITGTNFISTDYVYVNGAQLASTFVTIDSSSVIRARIPDYILSVPPPSGVLQISVSEQSSSGGPQTCTTDASLCQITVAAVRPGVVGPSPESIPQGSGGIQSFNVDGGFFGTGANPASPAVSASFNGQLEGIQLPPSQSIGSTRQLTVNIGGGSNSSSLTTPGLYPVSVINATDSSKFVTTNLAIQPTYTPPTATRIPVGSVPGSSAPNDVAVNPTTGMAVVANKGSNDVTLIDLTTTTPTFIANICTGAVGATPPCPSSGPSTVAVDYVRNIALVVNSVSQTLAVVDLNAQAVTYVISGFQNTPVAVGVNPVTGRALVGMQNEDYGVLVDLTVSPPALSGIVSISTGTNPRIAVEPNLNWALVTPGGLGAVAMVDLSQQSSNVITAISRTSNVVTVTVQNTATSPFLSVEMGDTVQIQNIQFPAGTPTSVASLAPTFNGFYEVTSVGPASNQFSYTQTGATQTNVASESAPQSASGTVNYSEPVFSGGVGGISVQGVGINTETQQAVLADPTTNSGGDIYFFNMINQSPTSLPLTVNGAQDVGTIAAAYNQLTNTVVAVNSAANTLSVIDPATPIRLNQNNLYTTLSHPVAVAIDPGTNIAVVANQGDNSVSVLNLGAIKPFSITETSPKTIITASTLGSAPNPSPQTLTVIGKGLTCSNGQTGLHVRLDGVALPTSCAGNGDRVLTATVPFSMLTSARRFALDVADSSGDVTNAEALTIEQSVDVTSCSPTPLPSGVAIDPVQNLAAVTLYGCNSLALINMATGSGSSVQVGANPIGVAVIPRLHLAVVANNGGAGTASIVDELQQSVTQTVSVGSGPIGAAADQDTAEVAIANSISNTVSVVNAVTGGVNTISTGQTPIAVAFNYTNHQVAVADASGSLVGVSDGAAGSQNESFSVANPTSVIYDPAPTDCGDNSNGTTTNTTGCFLASSSTQNAVYTLDPVTSVQTGFKVGVNPTVIAYNYLTSTLVTVNTLSHSVSVADFLAPKIRAVLPLPPTISGNSNLALSLAFQGALQYAVDIHPLTNIAVIADTANGRVLFLPLPH